jgi:hypothetical protein
VCKSALGHKQKNLIDTRKLPTAEKSQNRLIQVRGAQWVLLWSFAELVILALIKPAFLPMTSFLGIVSPSRRDMVFFLLSCRLSRYDALFCKKKKKKKKGLERVVHFNMRYLKNNLVFYYS